MLEGNGVYDEETLAVVNSFNTKFLHLETSSCLELFLAEEEKSLIVTSPPLINKCTIEFLTLILFLIIMLLKKSFVIVSFP